MGVKTLISKTHLLPKVKVYFVHFQLLVKRKRPKGNLEKVQEDLYKQTGQSPSSSSYSSSSSEEEEGEEAYTKKTKSLHHDCGSGGAGLRESVVVALCSLGSLRVQRSLPSDSFPFPSGRTHSGRGSGGGGVVQLESCISSPAASSPTPTFHGASTRIKK